MFAVDDTLSTLSRVAHASARFSAVVSHDRCGSASSELRKIVLGIQDAIKDSSL